MKHSNFHSSFRLCQDSRVQSSQIVYPNEFSLKIYMFADL